MLVKFEFDKIISYWNVEEGANVKVSGERDDIHWGADVSHYDGFKSIEAIKDIKEALEEKLKEAYLPYDYIHIMDDGRVSLGVIENGGGDIVDEEEQKIITANGEQLYICDYSVFITIHNEVYEPTVEQLREVFPEADY